MSEGISANARRWLDTISFAEGTWGQGAPRYDITFGYEPIKDLSRHPDRVVQGDGIASAAAGAYQFMPGTWQGVRSKLRLPDFGPASQDLAALELIRQRGVDPDRDPITRENVARLSGEWASLPTVEGKSAYGQPVKTFERLSEFAQKRGATASTSKGPQSSSVGPALLESFIRLFGSAGPLRGLERSGIPAPALPTYDESADTATNDELDVVLDAYKRNQETEAYTKNLRAMNESEQRSNLEAAERAKALLLKQALSTFGTPKSVI